MNAVASCGLQLYRFGETVSIPFWQDGWRPDSWYDAGTEKEPYKSRLQHRLRHMYTMDAASLDMPYNPSVKDGTYCRHMHLRTKS